MDLLICLYRFTSLSASQTCDPHPHHPTSILSATTSTHRHSPAKALHVFMDLERERGKLGEQGKGVGEKGDKVFVLI